MLFYANELGAYKDYGDGSKKNSEIPSEKKVVNNETKTDNNQSNSASKANLQS
jgi:hypothetical protein